MQTCKTCRQFRPEPQDFTAYGVFDRQYMGMKGLPAKVPERGLGRCRQKGGLGTKARPIGLIAQDRVADRSQVHPNLVGAPGFEAAGEEARYRNGKLPGP